MKIKTDQQDSTTSDWIEQIKRSAADLPIDGILDAYDKGGLFALLEPILLEPVDA